MEKPLALGALYGNRFDVILRSVRRASPSGNAPPTPTPTPTSGDRDAEGVRAELEAQLAAIRSRGFVNYFGMQRFGTGGTPTHVVGEALLKGAWQDAIHMIIKVRGAHARTHFIRPQSYHLK